VRYTAFHTQREIWTSFPKIGDNFMRLTISAAVCILSAFALEATAQLSEAPRFQPSTYAVPALTPPAPPAPGSATTVAVKPEQTDWERNFGQTNQESDEPVPYLTWYYDEYKGRFHLARYEPGYAESTDEFPISQSPLHRWKNDLFGHTSPTPQVQYMSYYDTTPIVILPAVVELKGPGESRLSKRFADWFNDIRLRRLGSAR
jgi:hypothetical protein